MLAARGPQADRTLAAQSPEANHLTGRNQPVDPVIERGAATRSSPTRVGEIDLCGYGRIKSEWIEFPTDAERPAMQAFARWADREAGAPNEIDRARGLFFRTRLTYDSVREAAASRLSGQVDNPNAICFGQCLKEAVRIANEAIQPDRDTIARMAAASRDPAVYALGLMTCGAFAAHRSGACGQLSHEQWAQLDPANAAPWLFIASEAQMRNLATARDEALQRAARLQRIDLRWEPVLEGVVAMADAPGNDTAQVIGLTLGAGISAALVVPSYSPVVSSCTVESMRDPSRRELCDALARLLVERGSTAVDFSVGRSLGERVGWPAERVAALRLEAQAIEAVNGGRLFEHSVYSCGWSRAIRELTLASAQLGELKAGRARIRASRQSVAELASAWDVRMKAERARIEARIAVPAAEDKPASASDARAVTPSSR